MSRLAFVFLTTFLALASGGLGFATKYYGPRIKPFLANEIKKQSKEFVHLGLEPENFDFGWAPLRLDIKKIDVTPIKKTKQFLSPFTVNNASIRLSLLELFKGNLKISNIIISDSNLNIIVKKFSENKKKSTFSSFRFLEKVPVENLTLKGVNLLLKLTPLKISMKAENIQLAVENLNNALIAEIDSEKITLKNSDDPRLFPFRLEGRFLLEDHRLIISKLVADHTEDTHLTIAGQIQGPWIQKKVNKFNINTKGQVNAQEVSGIIKAFVSKQKLPKTTGLIAFDVNYSESKINLSQPKFKIKTSDLYIENYEVGQLRAQAFIENKKLIVDTLDVKNSYTKLGFKESQLSFDKNLNFSAEAKIDQFQLNKLLDMLGKARRRNQSKKTSKFKLSAVNLSTQGQTSCKGSLKPKINILCDAKTNNTKFQLTKEKSEPLISVKNAQAQAQLVITNKDISYDGDVKINNSMGTAKGKVTYANGFYLDFDGEINDFAKDLDRLLGLELEGNAVLSGTVKGNSKTATIDSLVSCRQCSLKKWMVGDFESTVSYKKGLISFNEIKGYIGKSAHQSEISINIPKNSIVVDTVLPKVELKDIQMAIQENVKLPFTIDSTGRAQIKLWGPLKLQELSFDLVSNFSYGFINKESFDEAIINLKCVSGTIRTQKVSFKKADSQLNIYGQLKRTGELDIKGKIDSFQLKNSEYFNSLKTEIDGQVNLNANLTGFFSEPILSINGFLIDSNLEGNKSKNSQFELDIDKTRLKANINLNKGQLSSKVIYPFQNGDIYITGVAKNWNFSHLLVGLFPHFKKFNLYTNFNGNTNIVIPEKNFDKIEGNLSISSFFIFRGNYSVYLGKPLDLNFKNGQLRDFSVGFKGQRTDLKISSQNSSLANMNLSAKGRFDLGVGLIFSSFVEEFRGDTSVSLGFKGPITNLSVFGSAYIQNSTLKIFDVRQPIQNIDSELTIKNQSIIINNLVGKFGGGQINASGSVDFTNKIPALDLSGQVQGTEFKSIDNVSLFIDGNVQLKGKQLPYLLSADAYITKGSIKKSIQLDSKKSSKFKLSDYAPQDIIATKEKALQLDIKAKIDQDIPMELVTSQFEFTTQLNGEINITNTPQKPLLTGRLNFSQEGLILFRGNQYNLTTGQLRYENDPPGNPDLFIDAEGRVQDFDIQISVLGKGSDPKINFQSQPNLPEPEIINLVALGYTSSALDNEISSRQQTDQITYEVSSAILKERLGLTSGLNDKLGVEFDISSTYNDDQSNPIPTLTVKKRLGNKVEATASRTIEASATNSFKTEYKFNKNLSTIFSFTQQESKETSVDDNSGSEALGLDFEYKIEFK